MNIHDKTGPDPVSDLKIVDIYMRWALEATGQVVGEKGMAIVLREAGLERLIGNYPPATTTFGYDLRFGDYARFGASLWRFFDRAAVGTLLRIGRTSARMARDEQGALFNVGARLALKLQPLETQIRKNLEFIQNGYRQLSRSVGQDQRLSIEDRGDRWAYIAEDCALCAGQEANAAACILFTGVLKESLQWLTGKELPVEEVACRATGAPACVWEIGKKSVPGQG